MSQQDTKIPELIFVQEKYTQLLEKLAITNSLVIYDPFFEKVVPKAISRVMVSSNDSEQIDKIQKNHKFDNVIAIGGCTCHDIARMVADSKPYIIIPTILSTSCIGTNHAVIAYNGRNKIIKVTPPEKVVISLCEIMKKSPDLLMRWNASGVGDVLSGIGAGADVLFLENKPLTYENIRQLVPDYFELLDWLLYEFKTWDEASVKKLAEFEFHSSITSIKKGHTKLSTGGEHDFFDEMVYHYPEFKKILGPSHGELVFLGLLIEIKLLTTQTGDERLFNELKKVGELLRLPVNEKRLQAIHLSREQVETVLNVVVKEHPRSLLGQHLANVNITALLDDVLKESSND